MKIASLALLFLLLGLTAHVGAIFFTGTGALLGTAVAGGLGGLLGLKLVALKAGVIGGYIGSRLGRKRHYGYYAPSYRYRGYGHGGHGYGHGHGHGHGYHRRRRSAVDEEQVVTSDLPLEQYFAVVAAADLNGCGLKLVCELEAAEPSSLQSDEKLILALFGSVLPPTSESLARSAKAQYDMAAFLGLTGSSSACNAIYRSRCPYSRSELIEALRSIDPQ